MYKCIQYRLYNIRDTIHAGYQNTNKKRANEKSSKIVGNLHDDPVPPNKIVTAAAVARVHAALPNFC